jgi:hypothetical protein
MTNIFRGVAVGLAMLGVVPVSPVAAGTEGHGAKRATQLALARICVSEAGFQVKTNDCAAIYRVLKGRKNGGPLLRIMRRYSTNAFDRSRTDRRRWVAWLNSPGHKPKGWPQRTKRDTPHPPWSSFRPLWFDVYEHAGAILRGEVESPCDKPPDHWGGRFGIDLRRARAAGWEEVDCGNTLNAFWRVPR